ncbi:unnamed protein product [Polarella glacialis]|uniref:HTH La-type RNA-binding domain-containing protein n=1 Tax=Polarella glacialis TaxID=89957 RepID=A0A813EU97_POLGL|nr:unnamed protein product [Polarella glacialis]
MKAVVADKGTCSFCPPKQTEDDVVAKTREQLNYYFSDQNLRRDKFLLSRTGPDGTGFVSVDELQNFNRLKSIVSGSSLSVAEVVLVAAAMSDLLEVSSDHRIRRKQPLKEHSRTTRKSFDRPDSKYLLVCGGHG